MLLTIQLMQQHGLQLFHNQRIFPIDTQTNLWHQHKLKVYFRLIFLKSSHIPLRSHKIQQKNLQVCYNFLAFHYKGYMRCYTLFLQHIYILIIEEKILHYMDQLIHNSQLSIVKKVFLIDPSQPNIMFIQWMQQRILLRQNTVPYSQQARQHPLPPNLYLQPFLKNQFLKLIQLGLMTQSNLNVSSQIKLEQVQKIETIPLNISYWVVSCVSLPFHSFR